MNSPLISVIIPTFNRKKKLLQTIKKVIDQTWDNIEIIIINDGSEGGLKKAIQSFKNDNIIYIKTKQNLGCALSRLLGFQMSHGDFIAFLDDDDEWNNEFLNKQMDIFKKNNFLDFVISNYKINHSNEIKNMEPFVLDFKNQILKQPGPFFQCCIFKKKILKNMKNLIDTHSIPSEDWDFFINLSFLNPKIGFSNHTGFIWHFTKESQSANLLNEAKGISYLINKHKKIIIHSCGLMVLSNHYRRIARIYEKLNNFKKIKFYYIKAFFAAPYYWKNLLYIIIIMFGKNNNKNLINSVRKIRKLKK